MKHISLFLCISTTILALLLEGCGMNSWKSGVSTKTLDNFETELEDLRQLMKIPGMSVGVVKDGQLIWSHGFGYADIENSVPATDETPYKLASVTKPFAALVIMQLVQEGKLSLDDPVSRYGVSLPAGDKVTIRHLMSHTSAGTPGSTYQYDGARYGLLSQVIQAATGRSLQEWLFERILQPLSMNNTAPNPVNCTGMSFASTCKRVDDALAKPYRLDKNLNFAPGGYNTSFNAGSGLISTVIDLAKLDAALDANTLVTAETKALMFTPTVSNAGQELPYGLGWFSQSYRGTRFIWHYGLDPPSTSSLFFKIPDEGLTLIVLANTDGLSLPFQLGSGDIMNSLVALVFYKDFVLAPRLDEPLPAIVWTTDGSTVQTSINQIQDESVRELLRKEFRARQMVAISLALVREEARLLEEKIALAREIAKDIEPSTLDTYIGDYEIKQLGGITLSVRRMEDGLYIQQPDLTRVELLPLSETRFLILTGTNSYEILFTRDKANQVTGLVLSVEGRAFTGKRTWGPKPLPPTPTSEPSGMVDVGGYKLFYQCIGQGSPTVILESGGGADSSYWADVFNGIKDTTRVCMYDRANTGRSDSVSGTRTFYDMTHDLQVLLENAHIGGPYILVGWSMGGMLMRIFADQHPDDVRGIVLLDSGHPDMGNRLLACLPPESANEPENIQFLRQYTTWLSDSSTGPLFTSGEGAEWDTRTNNQQARAVSTLGDIPLVVISQAANIPGLGLSMITSRGPLPAEIDACLQQTWQDMQTELAGLSTNVTRLTARGGHMFPVEQPELIIQAIVELVNMVGMK